MTGDDIISEVQVMLGEGTSTVAQQQSQLYPRHARRAADQIASDTHSLYSSAVWDIIANQTEYNLPYGPYRFEGLNVSDSKGNIYPLASITPGQADEKYHNWRTARPQSWSGRPAFYIAEGLQTYKLFPVPNYDCQDGIIVSGYFGVGDWWDMADECPLSKPLGTQADLALSLGTAWHRCREMQRVDPTYAQLIPQYKNDFEAAICDLYRKAAGALESARGGAVPSRGSWIGGLGGWGLYY